MTMHTVNDTGPDLAEDGLPPASLTPAEQLRVNYFAMGMVEFMRHVENAQALEAEAEQSWRGARSAARWAMVWAFMATFAVVALALGFWLRWLP